MSRSIDTVFNHAPRYRVSWLDADGFLLLVVLWDEPPTPFDLPLGGASAVVLRWDVV